MKIYPRYRRWAWAAIGLVAVLTLIALVPRHGLTTETTAPLWTEQPVPVPAAAAPAPNWVALAKQLRPAVVNINTKRVEEGTPEVSSPLGANDPFNQFFKRFFGDQGPRTVRSLGSGFIISPRGYIVTNNHVVDKATEIRAKLADGRDLAAKVVGRDPKTDLALLKIDVTALPTIIPFGDSSQLHVGEQVMAIGNPFGLEETVTTGIVSATGRVIGEGPYDDFIQTDASINPGNSGGPLINTRGQAIGINTAIFSQTGGSVGIGFAIPINAAKSVVTQLASSGRVVRGWLGVAIQPVTPDLAKSFGRPDSSGALVASVANGSPAMEAGIQPGDVIVEYNGAKVARAEGLPRAVAETPIGREVPLTVVRDGKTLTLRAKIARLAEAEEAPTPAAQETAPLGLAVQSMTPGLARELGIDEAWGVLVRGVEDSSATASAGIRPGDVIVEVDHHPVKNVEDLKHTLDQHQAGTPILLLVHRDSGRLYVAVGS